MIKAKDRKQDVIKWHFPNDTKNPTLWYIKKQVGAEMVYLQALRLQESQEYTFDEWLNDTIIANIAKVENWENEKGDVVSLISPVDIANVVKLLTRNEIYLLMAAVSREGRAYDLGLLEKNSVSPLEQDSTAKNAEPVNLINEKDV